MSKPTNSKSHEQRFLERSLKRIQNDVVNEEDDRPKEWYDFHARTDEVLVPSRWISRLNEMNEVNDQFEYLRQKLQDDSPKETEPVDRETVYCSSAMRKLRQNEFYQRLDEHQKRWHSVTLIGEIAATLPKPTTDPKEIEKQLYMSLLNKK